MNEPMKVQCPKCRTFWLVDELRDWWFFCPKCRKFVESDGYS